MKKMKKLSSVIALVCLLLAAMLLVCACDNAKDDSKDTEESQTVVSTEETPTVSTEPSDGKVTYTVTVVDPDGKGVEGVMVQMCDDSGCKLPSATNAEGVITFRYKESNYHVTLSNLPAGLVAEAEYYFTNNSLRIVLKKA